MKLNQPPATIDWTPYLTEGEELLWTGESGRLRTTFGGSLGALFFGLCSWIFSRFIFQYDSLTEACGADPSSSCHSLYNFAWPYFLMSLAMTAVGVLLFAGAALGLTRQYCAVTSTRALSLDTMWKKLRAVDLVTVSVRRNFLGTVEFRASKYPSVVFVGLNRDQAEAAIFKARGRSASS